MENEKKEKIKKGRIIGYIGIVLIIAIVAYLVYAYLSYDKDKDKDDDYNSDLVVYQKLICKSGNSYDDYEVSNVISLSYDNDELAWVYVSNDYFYFSNEAYTSALSNLDASEDSTITYQSSDDNLTISAICEGDGSVIGKCLTDIDSTTTTSYTNLYKYFKNLGYSCEE